MNPITINTFMAEVRNCAMAMMEAGAYIQRELPNIQLLPTQREAADRVCAELSATKHDVMSEIFELRDLVEQGDETQVMQTIDLTLSWMMEAVQQLREITDTLQTAAIENPEFRAAFILFAESFMNTVEPFTRAQKAADFLRRN